jgi:hypothetical protein
MIKTLMIEIREFVTRGVTHVVSCTFLLNITEDFSLLIFFDPNMPHTTQVHVLCIASICFQ